MSYKTQLTFNFFGFRKVFFDLIVEHTEWNGVTRAGCFKLPPPLLCDQHDVSSWLWDAVHGMAWHQHRTSAAREEVGSGGQGG